MTTPPTRCAWAVNDLAIRYHDEEWGTPVHDDRHWFELLLLEGAQAGLSWNTILRRREGYRKAFDGFEPTLVAGYDLERQLSLMNDPDIIRNRLKIAAAVRNAGAFLAIQVEHGSFDAYMWGNIDGRPRQNAWPSADRVPARTAESDKLSRDLKRRGFSFVGPTICYALMQAAGLVNDHTIDCFRHAELGGQPRG